MAIDRPYADLKVLDLGQGIAAPHCAMLLAMQGAEIVKLEPPAGDWSRGLGARYGDHTAMSLHYNRGKRSIALDLKAPAARDVAIRLAEQTDILVEGFRPGVAARLGLGYEALRAANPRLVYVSVSGFGDEGPYADLPCTDSVAQAFSGMMAVNLGNDGAPHRIGAMVVDTVTGLYAAQAVGAALYRRERTGMGGRVAVGLAETAAAMLGHKLAEHVLEAGRPRAPNVPTGAYRTADGWIMIALIREADFARLAVALDRPDLAEDPRFADFAARAANAAPLFAALRAAFAARPTAYWLERLQRSNVLADRVNGFDDWLQDPHVTATGAAVAVDHAGVGRFVVPRTPGIAAEAERGLSPAPAIGQHGSAILAELGYDAAAIAGLAAEGALFLPEAR